MKTTKQIQALVHAEAPHNYCIKGESDFAMRLSENPIVRGMTKLFHMVPQANCAWHLALIPVEFARNTADILTKPLDLRFHAA